MLFFKEGEGNSLWLWYSEEEEWMVRDRAEGGQWVGNGWAHCVEKGLNSPADAATWKVWSGKEWEVSPAVKCDYLNAAEVARVTKARDEYWEGAH